MASQRPDRNWAAARGPVCGFEKEDHVQSFGGYPHAKIDSLLFWPFSQFLRSRSQPLPLLPERRVKIDHPP